MYLTGLRFDIRYYDHDINEWVDARGPYSLRYTYNGSTMEIDSWINPNGKFSKLEYDVDPLLVYLLTKFEARDIDYSNAATWVETAGRHSTGDVYRGHSERGMYLSALLDMYWDNPHVYRGLLRYDQLVDRVQADGEVKLEYSDFSLTEYRLRAHPAAASTTKQEMLDKLVGILERDSLDVGLLNELDDMRLIFEDASRDRIDATLFVEFLNSIRIEGEPFYKHDITIKISPVAHSTNRRLEFVLLDTTPSKVIIDDEVQS